MVNKTPPFKKSDKKEEKIIAIAGNPNVGKSTVFNALTGMHQHTGNWPGKTVSNATGFLKTKKYSYKVIDIPGTYSLNPQSAEEEVARSFLMSQTADAVLIVCDATCIEKNLNLVFQIMECCDNILVCVNLLDEAKKKGISVNTQLLSELLGVPVIGIVAHKKESIQKLKNFFDEYFDTSCKSVPRITVYDEIIENEIKKIEISLKGKIKNTRFYALKILEGDTSLLQDNDIKFLKNIANNSEMSLKLSGYTRKKCKQKIAETKIKRAQETAKEVTSFSDKSQKNRDMIFDKILTGKYTGIPIMMLMIAFIFWITIEGANYISDELSNIVFFAEDKLYNFFTLIKTPEIVSEAVVYGGFRVLGWIISVMLPPMAIFFPFFTILEDSGYLARIAYNLDKPFYKCNACGKQALTMCMGFGCNTVGVTGTRIIDSPRERLLAIITNSFMPCNGRFPMLITLITIFFVGINNSGFKSVLAALILAIVIFCAVLLTFAVTKLLSVTILKGIPSSYVLELPSYRRPQFGKLIVRSVFDRTLFVLGRAIAIAIPSGFFIWALGNITVGGVSILNYCSHFLEPFAQLMGLDGVILLAFILGTPANEIVIPLMLMMYLGENTLIEAGNYSLLEQIFIGNGWDITTAVCVIIFTVFHWPCATTLLSIKKESGSIKWTVIAFLVPTTLGIFLCILMNFLLKIFL